MCKSSSSMPKEWQCVFSNVSSCRPERIYTIRCIVKCVKCVILWYILYLLYSLIAGAAACQRSGFLDLQLDQPPPLVILHSSQHWLHFEVLCARAAGAAGAGGGGAACQRICSWISLLLSSFTVVLSMERAHHCHHQHHQLHHIQNSIFEKVSFGRVFLSLSKESFLWNRVCKVL